MAPGTRGALAFAIIGLLGGRQEAAAAEPATASTNDAPLVLSFEGGFTHSSDPYGGPADSALFGVAASDTFAHGLFVSGRARTERGSATYFSTSPSLGGAGPARLDVREYLDDVSLGAGIALPLGDSASIAPSLSARALFFENAAFPSYLAGARVGVLGSLFLSERLSADADLGWTYGLAKSVTGSTALGAPINDFDLGLAATLHLGHSRFAIQYLDEIVAFQYTTRRYDGLIIGFGRGF